MDIGIVTVVRFSVLLTDEATPQITSVSRLVGPSGVVRKKTVKPLHALSVSIELWDEVAENEMRSSSQRRTQVRKAKARTWID